MYYVGYVVYFQLNIDYIINTYCVNKEKPQLSCKGKCHLVKQLNSSSNEDFEGLSSLLEAFFPVYFQNLEYKTSVIYLVFYSKPHWNYYLDDANRYVSDCFHPPKQIG